MMVRKTVLLSGLIGATVAASFLLALPAQAAPGGVPGPSAWSHEGGHPGCGAAEVAVPQQSAAYYAAHPDAFVTDPDMPSGMRAELEQIAKREPTVVTDISCSRGHAHKPTDQISSSTGSYNWSGYKAALPNGGVGVYTSMSWTEPTMTALSTNSYMSIWPGLGAGSGSDELVQAGTEHDDTPGVHAPYFWHEMYPQNPYEVVLGGGMTASAGDGITILVYFATGAKIATFDFYNNTKNTYTSMTEALASGQTFQGHQVEWIVERPTVGGGYPPLAKFTTISVSNARYQPSGSGVIYATAANSAGLYMYDYPTGTRTLATPGAIGVGTFTDTWVASS